MKLVNFNYEHFKAGRPVVTRDGRDAKFIREGYEGEAYPLHFEITDKKRTLFYTDEGTWKTFGQTNLDLMHPADLKWDNPTVTPEDTPQVNPEDKEVWLRLYCALITDVKYKESADAYEECRLLASDLKASARIADHALSEYKKRWA